MSDQPASDQYASDQPASDGAAINRATLEAFSSTVVRLSDRDCWWQVTPAADGVGKSWLNDVPVPVISAVYSHDVTGVRVVGCADGAVLNESRYHLRYGNTRPFAMGDPYTPEHRVACAPPQPTDEPDGQRQLAEWVTTWQQRYGLLRCDVCKGNIRGLEF